MIKVSLKQSIRQFSTSRGPLEGSKVFKNTWGEKNNMTQLKAVIENVNSRKEESETAMRSADINPRFQVQIRNTQQYDPFDFTVAKRKLLIARNMGRMGNQPFEHDNQIKNDRKSDVFRTTGIDPRDLYLFGGILNRYVSESGRIYHRDVNVGLSKRTHKRLTKAIQRARAAGIISNTSRATSYSYSGVIGRSEEMVQAYHEQFQKKDDK